MKFAFVPVADYKLGQVIEVNGCLMRVESFTPAGRNFHASSIDETPASQGVLCIVTDQGPIVEVRAGGES